MAMQLDSGMYYLPGFDVVYDNREIVKRYLDPNTMTPKEPVNGVSAIQTSPGRDLSKICADVPQCTNSNGVVYQPDPGLLDEMIYLWGLDLILHPIPAHRITTYRHPETRLVFNPYLGMPAMIDDGYCNRYFQYDRGGVIHREDGPAVEWNNEPENDLYILRGFPLATGGQMDLARKIVMEPENLTDTDIEMIKGRDDAERTEMVDLAIARRAEAIRKLPVSN